MDMDVYRDDIEHSIEYWKDLLISDFNDVEYAYAKGSAIKPWQSEIDYVPMVSDIDIHFKYRHPSDLLGDTEDPALLAIDIANKYETEFQHLYPDSSHIPRIQLIQLDEQKLKSFIPPLPKQIRPILGKPQLYPLPVVKEFRKADFQNLLDSEEYIRSDLPDRVLDRIGIEFWTVVRQLTWRLSPTPIRLLTQVLEIHPAEIWTWNRTTIVTHLKDQDYEEIATHYSNFYLLGWELFEDNFQSSEIMRNMIREAYLCINKTIKAGKSLNAS